MFIAIGGLIAIMAYRLGNIDKDTTTTQENVVDLIRCRRLEVIGKNGKTVASLDALELEIEKIMVSYPEEPCGYSTETASRAYCLCECGIRSDY